MLPERTWSSWLQDSPAKCLGIARVLGVLLYVLKGKEKLAFRGAAT